MTTPRLIVSASAGARLDRAAAWLAGRPRGEEVVVIGANLPAATELCRVAAAQVGAAFGWRRTTLPMLASALAAPRLASLGLAPAGMLALEALCARVIHRLGDRSSPAFAPASTQTPTEDALGRFAPIADRPGLARAVAATVRALRLAGAEPDDPALRTLATAFAEDLAAARLADRALIYRMAAEAAEGATRHELLDAPTLLLDAPVRSALERRLITAILARAPAVLVTLPAGDERSLRSFPDLTSEPIETEATTALARVQRDLFAERSTAGTADDTVVIFSAPGESRECIEIARHACREAERGTRFDRMAILLRAPGQYRAHLEEALRRAGIPACFATGTLRPDPAGRAFLALLACAHEDLSARRFAEYLSLGEHRQPDAPVRDRWVPADEELGAQVAPDPDPDEPVAPSPRSWEQFLIDAAVIGGRARWERRLDGLAAHLRLQRRGHDDDPALGRREQDLAGLRAFALPLLDAMTALPRAATWGEWIDLLGALATRALRHPERVLAVLGELAPMAAVGPVDLRELRLVLGRRLAEAVRPASPLRHGHILVAPVDAARGLAFDVVFVPGLSEKLFPQKVSEDPLLRDDARRALSLDLETTAERAAGERLALRLAVGAARRRLIVSYPRLDLEQGRPRVPSFYALELLRATTGRLPGFDDLGAHAERAGAARIGWPAPSSPADAIDEAEHDLAILQDQLETPTTGVARYLLGANPHLARALRVRARRWIPKWTRADGLYDPIPEARAVLAQHTLAARSFSATALQTFAACPYRFFLHTIHRLAPRQVPEPIEEIDPLSRGSLVHETQFELLSALRDAHLLPITAENLEQARGHLDQILDRLAARYRDDLAPAIERVWDDGVAAIRADLREWLRLWVTRDGAAWTPWRFELAFGLSGHTGGADQARDPASQDAPVALDCGIKLRGAIDLVELRRGGGAVRATDHKTGRVRAHKGSVIGGGEHLQPVLYALALEKLFPDLPVESGRLYYCTHLGGFESVATPLHDTARASAEYLARTVGAALDNAELPAAPAPGACEWCDFRAVCGPHEERRAAIKRAEGLVPLQRLRGLP